MIQKSMTNYAAEFKVVSANYRLQLCTGVPDVFKDIFGRTDRSLSQHYIKINVATSRFINIVATLSNNTKELREIRNEWENKIEASIMLSENRMIASIYRRIDALEWKETNQSFNITREMVKISKRIEKIPKLNQIEGIIDRNGDRLIFSIKDESIKIQRKQIKLIKIGRSNLKSKR
jgi:tetrahydromethanopterin S-methyltransferase subunit H